MGDQNQSTHIFPRQPEAGSNKTDVTILAARSKPGVAVISPLSFVVKEENPLTEHPFSVRWFVVSFWSG
jgi:hypothetical protein